MDMPKIRYRALDALRGLSVLLMILHHLAIDLVMYGIAPAALLENPILYILQPLFASCFVALSGASSRFSRSNLRRGGKIMLAALTVSAVTISAQYFLMSDDANIAVMFGILNFLGLASVLYHFARPLLDRLKVHGFVWLALFVGAYYFFPLTVGVDWLFPLGLMGPSFQSADYYPLLPWIFMYLFGAWMADQIRENKLPAPFYEVKFPLLETVSRHSLWIFLLHQPILIALFELYFRVIA